MNNDQPTRFLFLFLAGIYLSTPAQKEDRPYVYHRIDSASLGNDLVLEESRLVSDAKIEGTPDSLVGKDSATEISSYKIVDGFRIQIYATTNFTEAERKKEDLLSALDEKVYVIYDAPYYKIRAGNFEKEENCKKLKKQLLELGFDIYIVKSKIRVKK